MDVLDLHKVRIFYAVARLASFTRAAQQLHMAQPTVSQQIAALENTLGVLLFERSTRHLHLTEAGKTLYGYAEQLLALSNEAIKSVQAAAGVAEQTLKLGVGHILATYLLPDALSRYRTQYPQYMVRLSVGNTTELLALLVAGEIDLALVGSPAEHPEVVAEPFMRDSLVVIVCATDEWVGRKNITPELLRQRVLLTREPGSALYSTIARQLGEDALTNDNVILLGETEGIKRSVELGLGVALIQRIAIMREIEMGTLHAIPLSDADDKRTYLIARRKRGVLSEAASFFTELLKDAPLPLA